MPLASEVTATKPAIIRTKNVMSPPESNMPAPKKLATLQHRVPRGGATALGGLGQI